MKELLKSTVLVGIFYWCEPTIGFPYSLTVFVITVLLTS